MTVFKVNSIIFRIILWVCLFGLAAEPVLNAIYNKPQTTDPAGYIFIVYLLAMIVGLVMYARKASPPKWLRIANIILCSIWALAFVWFTIEMLLNGQYPLIGVSLLFVFFSATAVLGFVRDMKAKDEDGYVD